MLALSIHLQFLINYQYNSITQFIAFQYLLHFSCSFKFSVKQLTTSTLTFDLIQQYHFQHNSINKYNTKFPYFHILQFLQNKLYLQKQATCKRLLSDCNKPLNLELKQKLSLEGQRQKWQSRSEVKQEVALLTVATDSDVLMSLCPLFFIPNTDVQLCFQDF